MSPCRRPLTVAWLALLLVAGGAGASEPTTVTGSVQVQPLQIELIVEPPFVATGERIRIQATVTNLAQHRLKDVKVGLRHPNRLLLMQPTGEHHVPRLHGGPGRTLHWRGCAGQPGSYGLLARAEYETADGQPVTVESDTRLVHVDREGRPPCR